MKTPGSHWTLYAIALGIIALIFSGIVIFWHTILLAILGWTAWRVMWRRLVGPPSRRRGNSRLDSARKWIETGAAVAIAHRVGPQQARKTDGIPQRVWKRVRTQSEDLPF